MRAGRRLAAAAFSHCRPVAYGTAPRAALRFDRSAPELAIGCTAERREEEEERAENCYKTGDQL